MAAQKKVDEYRTWITREESCDMLGVTRETLHTLVKRGRLHPQKVIRADTAGRMREMDVLDPKELATIPRPPRDKQKTPGTVAARAFELFQEGKSLVDIVIDIRETPDAVAQLRERWLDMGGATFVISPGARTTLEGMVGSFGSVAELIDRVQHTVAAKPSQSEAAPE